MEAINYPKPSNTLSIAGLALALLAIVISLIPCFGVVAYIPALLGLIFAIIGLSQNEQYRTPKSIAITGIAISIIAFLIAGIWTSMMDSFSHRAGKELYKHVSEIIENVEKKLNDTSLKLKFEDNVLTEEQKEELKARSEEISELTQKIASKTLDGIKSVEIETEGSHITIKIPKKELTDTQIQDLKTEINELEAKIRHYISDFSITFEQTEEEGK